MQNFEVRQATLFHAMLDIEQIVNDLIALRETKADSQRDFGDLSGLGYAKVNRIETRRNKRGLPVEDMTAWLEACGSSMVEFYGYHAMVDRLKDIINDEELEKLLRLALTLPVKREDLRNHLRGSLRVEMEKVKERTNTRRAVKKKEAG